MAARTLTTTIVNSDGEPQEGISVTITPTSSDTLLAVGDDVLRPVARSGDTDASGETTFELLPSSESGTRYSVRVGDNYRAIFEMPDEDTTLAAALTGS